MKMSLKIALSLLISVVLFAVFFVVASSGLFNIVEAALYVPRIKEDYMRGLEKTASELEIYHKNMKARFEVVLAHDYIPSAFLQNQTQSKNDIMLRDESFSKLIQMFPDLLIVRFISEDGKFIYYSTQKSDLSVDRSDLRSYYTYDQVEKNIKGLLLVSKKGEKPKVTIDGTENRFIYSFPVADRYDIYKGTALFYVSVHDISKVLVNIEDIIVREPVALIDTQGLLIGIPTEKINAIKDEILASWARNEAGDSFSEVIGITIKDNASPGSYFLFSKRTAESGMIGIVVSKNIFEIAQSQKIIIYILFFITVYLIVFIIFNLRQDPVSILSERIKLLQISFIKQFIESKHEIDWSKWHLELAAKRPEIARYIRGGIGRINKKQTEDIDYLINRGWDEILSVVSKRAEIENREAGFDMSRIEEIIAKALSQGNIVIPAKQIPDLTEKSVTKIREQIGERDEKPIISSQDADVLEAEEMEEAEDVEEIVEVEDTVGADVGSSSIPTEDSEIAEVTEITEADELESVIDIEEITEVSGELPSEKKGESGKKIEMLDADVELLKTVGDKKAGDEVIFEEEVEVIELTDIGIEFPDAFGELEDIEVEAKEKSEPEKKDHTGRSLEDIEEVSLESIEGKTDFTEFSDASSIDHGVEPPVDDDQQEMQENKDIQDVTIPGKKKSSIGTSASDASRIAISDDTAGSLKKLFDRVDEEITKKEKQSGIGSEKIFGKKHGVEADAQVQDVESVDKTSLTSKSVLDDLPELELVENPAEYLDHKRGGKYFLLPKKARFSLVFAGQINEIDDVAGSIESGGEPDEGSIYSEEENLMKELISLSTVPGDHADAKSHVSVSEKEIEGMLKTKKFLVYSISEMLAIYSSMKKSIVVEGGVYRIKKELFSSLETGGDNELKELIQSVSGDATDSAGQEPDDHDRVRLDPLLKDSYDAPKVTVRTKGIEYDSYMRMITKKTDDITIVKSLVSLSKKLESIYAGIITEHDKKYKMEYSVGLQDQTKKMFCLLDDDPYVRFFFLHKRAFLVNLPVDEIVSLKTCFSDYDRKFLNGLAFLPAVFKGKDAYLFLGFPKFEQRDLRMIFAGLVL